MARWLEDEARRGEPAGRDGAVTINSEMQLSLNVLGLDIPGRLAPGHGAKFASSQAWSWLRLTPPAALPCEGCSIIRDTVWGIREVRQR